MGTMRGSSKSILKEINYTKSSEWMFLQGADSDIKDSITALDNLFKWNLARTFENTNSYRFPTVLTTVCFPLVPDMYVIQ